MIRGRSGRLRRPSFVPTVREVCPDSVEWVPGLEEAIVYWTGDAGGARGWVGAVLRKRGSCGLYLSRGDEVLGFCLYAGGEDLPRLADYPFGPPEGGAVALACVSGDPRGAKRLVVRMLRGFKSRGTTTVRAVASDGGREHHAHTAQLLGLGWHPLERGLCRGRFYTLVGLDLGNTVEAGELARSLIGQVRLPQLRSASPGTLAFEKLAPEAGGPADAPREPFPSSLPADG